VGRSVQFDLRRTRQTLLPNQRLAQFPESRKQRRARRLDPIRGSPALDARPPSPLPAGGGAAAGAKARPLSPPSLPAISRPGRPRRDRYPPLAAGDQQAGPPEARPLSPPSPPAERDRYPPSRWVISRPGAPVPRIRQGGDGPPSARTL